MRRALTGLALACHPGPCVAVTAFAAALAVRADLSTARVIVLAAAVLTGQLSIGWLNDYLDRDLDREAARTDKPLPQGRVGVPELRYAIPVAAVACLVLSLGLGIRPGLLHIAAVASAWSYDLWLKPTVASWAPFALSFALLPAVVTTASAGHPWPRWEIVVAGGLLGVAAHLTNTVKDVWADQVTHVRGLPQIIGPTASSVLGAALVALAGVALVLATPHSAVSRIFAVAAVLVAAAGGVTGRRTAFTGTVVAAALVVAGLVLSGPLPAG